jgi:hypothetical protein
VGIFFDRNKFRKDKAYFGPYAYRERDNLNVEIQKKYQMVDLTGLPGGYINEEWFTVIYLTIQIILTKIIFYFNQFGCS